MSDSSVAGESSSAWEESKRIEALGLLGEKSLRDRLTAGLDPDSKDHAGTSLASKAAAAGDLDALKMLALAGADLDAADLKGFGPLAYAIELHRLESVSALLALGANPDPESRGFNPLAHAIACGLPEAVEALLAAGADPNRRTTAGHAPLAVAVRHMEVRAARALIAAGADVGARVDDDGGSVGFDALGLIVRESVAGNPDPGEALALAEALIEGGADPNAPWGPAKRLSLTACCGNEKRRPWARMLLRAGADPDAKDGSGSSSRDVAVRCGTSAMLEEEIAVERARREASEIYESIGPGGGSERMKL